MRCTTTWAVLFLALGAFGCASSKPAPMSIQAKGFSSELVQVAPPSATQDEGVLIVSGTVTRKAGHDDPVAGHLHVMLMDALDNELDEIPIRWMPSDIPTDGSRSASYVLRYGQPLPTGGRVLVAVADDAHDDGTPYVARGGPSGGGSRFTYTPRTAGTPRTRGTAGTPGMSSKSGRGAKR